MEGQEQEKRILAWVDYMASLGGIGSLYVVYVSTSRVL